MFLDHALALSEEALEQTPDRPAVFMLWPLEGEPYLARTNLLRRRLKRMARMGDMRQKIARVEYWLSGSTLEAHIRMYRLARQYFPKRYLEMLRLRMPPYVKLLLGNPFPRAVVAAQIAGVAPGLYVGPFRSRASAERFEEGFLELFQMRRCQEDLAPSPQHPGCMYGEMGMCLRPCQQAVGVDEYRSEVARVEEFLKSEGASLIGPALSARDQFSAEMDFEQAASQHARIEKIEQIVKMRDELARPLHVLNGVAVTQSSEPDSIELSFVRAGHWQGKHRVNFHLVEGKPVSLDQRLRETILTVGEQILPPKERQEYLAILSRWFYSSWRDGEFLMFDSFERIPYKKLVHTISRVHRAVV